MEFGGSRLGRGHAARIVFHRRPRRSCRGRLSILRQRSDRVLRDGRRKTERAEQKRSGQADCVRGRDALVATVFDLFCANYGLDRGLGGEWVAKDYSEDVPGTPAWAEKINGVPAAKIIHVAREFASNAEKTRGKSMVIIGAGDEPLVPHGHELPRRHQHAGAVRMRGTFRGRLGPLRGPGKAPAANRMAASRLRSDWSRPPRQMNSTSMWYAHSDQWRYETLTAGEDRFADGARGRLGRQPDRLQHPRRADGMAAVGPAIEDKPVGPSRAARRRPEPKCLLSSHRNWNPATSGCHAKRPDAPENWPRNLFVWRSNLLGSSGKGHEYFLKHLLGTDHGVIGRDLGAEGRKKPKEAVWRDDAPRGKLDLLVCIDFRMSTTAVYSDVVLPTASWYEKNDLNTSDMHPFIHPLQAAVDPAYESKSDWEIFKAIARKFQDIAPEILGKETDVVAVPILHDTPAELAQDEVLDWKKGECDLVPGKTAPSFHSRRARLHGRLRPVRRARPADGPAWKRR